MIEQYERAVLEWFHEVWPDITDMVYAESKDALLAKKPHLVYPTLIYKREAEDFSLIKAVEVKEPAEDGKAHKHTMYQIPQDYEAQLFLNNEKDLYLVANLIRQKWGRESYATLRYPNDDTQMRVALRLISFRLSSERSGIDTKGPERVLVMRWRSVLILEAIQIVPRYTGYRVTLTGSETWQVVSTCKEGQCEV